MTATVIYNGKLRTTCTHVLSGSAIETDAPLDNNGKGERFSPTDLLSTSLAACMITVMGIKSQTMGFDLDNVKIEVTKIMKSEPRRVGEIKLKFNFPEPLKNIEAKQKKILINTAETCPVKQSIHPDILVDIDWGEWK